VVDGACRVATVTKRREQQLALLKAREQVQREEFLYTARCFAMAGLPRRRVAGQVWRRFVRVAANQWLLVVYSTDRDTLPFGRDRVVLALLEHLAVETRSGSIEFERAGELLERLGLPEDGGTLERFRGSLERLAGLKIGVRTASTREALEQQQEAAGFQWLAIRRYQLPTRAELANQRQGVLPFRKGGVYGVELSADFVQLLHERRNRLLMPLALVRHFSSRPLGFDVLAFLLARAGAAQRESVIPHDALLDIFGGEDTNPRKLLGDVADYVREICALTGLRAAMVSETERKASRLGGRPRVLWSLRVWPKRSDAVGELVP